MTAENLPVARQVARGAPAGDGFQPVVQVALHTVPSAAGTAQLVKLAPVAVVRVEQRTASTWACC